MPTTLLVPQLYPVGSNFLQSLPRWLVVSHVDGKIDVVGVIHIVIGFGSSVKGGFGHRPYLGFGYGRQWRRHSTRLEARS